MTNYSYSSPSSPVVCIPKNQSDSLERDRKHTRNEVDDFLVSETLFMGDLPSSLRETDIKTLLQHCMPIDVHIRCEGNNQDDDDGYLLFSDKKYADKAYTLYHGFKFTNGATLQLRMYRNPSLEPEALGDILEVNNWSTEPDAVHRLYDIFRPFGPLQLCISNGQGTAMIQYFNRADSDRAIYQADGMTVDGNKITIAPQPFGKDGTTASETLVSSNSPKIQQKSQPQSGQQLLLQHKQQPSQQKQLLPSQEDHQQQTPTPTVKPNFDYLNLYIKNMDPLITNDYLYEVFGKFGKIVSARVISNPVTKQSRGYGFVSFSREEEAANALQEMDGQMVLSKPLYVSYHEPKKGRNDNNTSNSASPITKNTTAINNNNVKMNSNINHNPLVKEHPLQSTMRNEIPHNNGTNPPGFQSYQQEQYIATPVVNLPRKQDPVMHQIHPSTALIEEMNPYKNNTAIKLPRRKSSVVEIPSPKPSLVFPSPVYPNLGGHIQRTQTLSHHREPTPRKTTNNAFMTSTVSAFTPLAHSPTPDRRRISTESIMTDTSASVQRQKLTNAVIQSGCCSKDRSSDIVDLLLTLNRKERSLCLFNADFLKEKVMLALDSLDVFDDEDEDVISTTAGAGHERQHMIETHSPLPLRTNPIRASNYHSHGPTTHKTKTSNSTQLPVTPPLSSLSTSDLTSGPVTPATIDDFLASIASLSIHSQKQKLGDVMWNYVKPLAKPLAKAHHVPGFSSKVLVELLDNVPLRDLAHGINDKKWLQQKVEEAANTIHQA